MVIKQEVAYGIVNSIADLRKGDDLEDFTVIVDETGVRCHSFLLGACSHFFRALLRCDMKERNENNVTLKDVSHSTFTLILTALYTGVDVLTRENVINVWHAANLLQIGFLVKECENFVIKHLCLENYEDIYHQAKILDSKSVLRNVQNFMLKNFGVFRKSQLLLELPFDELLSLLKSDDLVVASEDEVVETILKWISFVSTTVNTQGSSDETSRMGNDETVSAKNDKEDNDVSLDSVCSDTKDDTEKQKTETGDVVESLNLHDVHKSSEERHDAESSIQLEQKIPDFNQKNDSNNLSLLVTNTTDKKDVVPCNIQEQNKPMLQEKGKKHLFVLMSASRLCLASSKCLEVFLKHPMIMDNKETRDLVVEAVCYQMQIGRRHGQWPPTAVHRRQSDLENVMIWNGSNTEVYSFDDGIYYKIAASPDLNSYVTWFNNTPYLVNRNKMYIYKEGVWTYLFRGPGYKPIALPCENNIYFFNKSSGEGHKFTPLEVPLELHTIASFPGGKPVTSASSFKEKVLVFNSEVEDDEELTGVHSFDTETETWEKLDNIKGPAENLISFHDDKNTYLLQMWREYVEGHQLRG